MFMLYLFKTTFKISSKLSLVELVFISAIAKVIIDTVESSRICTFTPSIDRFNFEAASIFIEISRFCNFMLICFRKFWAASTIKVRMLNLLIVIGTANPAKIGSMIFLNPESSTNVSGLPFLVNISTTAALSVVGDILIWIKCFSTEKYFDNGA